MSCIVVKKNWLINKKLYKNKTNNKKGDIYCFPMQKILNLDKTQNFDKFWIAWNQMLKKNTKKICKKTNKKRKTEQKKKKIMKWTKYFWKFKGKIFYLKTMSKYQNKPS